MPNRWTVPVRPTDRQSALIASRPSRSTTVPVHVLSLTMIIITRASRRVMVKPGVRCWKVPESLSWYFARMVTGRSRVRRPAWTAWSAAIRIEIFRVLADGTTTWPWRSGVSPVQTWIRNVPEVRDREGWAHAAGLDRLGLAFGISLAQADAIARAVSVDDVLAYADAVLAENVSWLGTVTAGHLDQVPDSRAHLA